MRIVGDTFVKSERYRAYKRTHRSTDMVLVLRDQTCVRRRMFAKQKKLLKKKKFNLISTTYIYIIITFIINNQITSILFQY
jgi:hypothetical protein